MTIVVSALSPVVDLLSAGIDALEGMTTSFLERHKIIPPAVDTLDMSLTVKQVNATINLSLIHI